LSGFKSLRTWYICPKHAVLFFGTIDCLVDPAGSDRLTRSDLLQFPSVVSCISMSCIKHRHLLLSRG
jgi:hypothetical protein